MKTQVITTIMCLAFSVITLQGELLAQEGDYAVGEQ